MPFLNKDKTFHGLSKVSAAVGNSITSALRLIFAHHRLSRITVFRSDVSISSSRLPTASIPIIPIRHSFQPLQDPLGTRQGMVAGFYSEARNYSVKICETFSRLEARFGNDDHATLPSAT